MTIPLDLTTQKGRKEFHAYLYSWPSDWNSIFWQAWKDTVDGIRGRIINKDPHDKEAN